MEPGKLAKTVCEYPARPLIPFLSIRVFTVKLDLFHLLRPALTAADR